MPQATVRHGLISYMTKDEESGQDYEARAFRGMTVELSQKEYDRLLKHGAIVPADQELAQPGRLLALPAGASDEEILNWALAAQPSEITAMAQARPELADRLRDAHAEVRRRVEQYNEHLGGVIEAADKAAQEAAERRQQSADTPQQVTSPVPGSLADQRRRQAEATGDGGGSGDGGNADNGGARVEGEQQLAGDNGGTEAGAGQNSPDYVTPSTGGTPAETTANADGTVSEDVAAFDQVVAGNVGDVQKYLGSNPEHAGQVLDAENRRAERENEKPRPGVIRAAEVAAKHAQQ